MFQKVTDEINLFTKKIPAFHLQEFALTDWYKKNQVQNESTSIKH